MRVLSHIYFTKIVKIIHKRKKKENKLYKNVKNG